MNEVAMVVDGRVVSNPRINTDHFDNTGIRVSGSFSSEADAERIAAAIGPRQAAAEASAFCKEYGLRPSLVPESYVGSPQHVAQLRRLAQVAPASLKAALSSLIAYMAHLDHGNPNANVITNMPSNIQAAIAQIKTEGDRCSPKGVVMCMLGQPDEAAQFRAMTAAQQRAYIAACRSAEGQFVPGQPRTPPSAPAPGSNPG
jgi:hypothetical protein